MMGDLHDNWMVRFRIASDWLYIRMCIENIVRLYGKPGQTIADLAPLLHEKTGGLEEKFLMNAKAFIGKGRITREDLVRIMLHPKRYIEWQKGDLP